MTIGERIRSIRESKGILQQDLASSLPISGSYLSQIEQGAKIPSFDLICELAKALNVPLQDVICDYLETSEKDSIPEQAKIIIEQYSPNHQKLILEYLKLLLSRMP